MGQEFSKILKNHNKLLLTVFLMLAAVIGCTAAVQKKIIEVPYITQQGDAVTGCELVSAAMLLQYHGKQVTVDQVIESAPMALLTETPQGLTGPHPAEAFIGDPYSESGLGCYAPVVVKVLDSFLEEGKKAVDATGAEFSALVRDYIDHDRPVLIWATREMKEPKPGDTWTLDNSGESFQWLSGEHCMVLVGYDRSSYYFNDPYESNGVVSFPKRLVERRYKALGKQAVAIQ